MTTLTPTDSAKNLLAVLEDNLVPENFTEILERIVTDEPSSEDVGHAISEPSQSPPVPDDSHLEYLRARRVVEVEVIPWFYLLVSFSLGACSTAIVMTVVNLF